jgi:putative ABC transport system permease protein
MTTAPKHRICTGKHLKTVRALNKKLLRDAKSLWGQLSAIVMVLGAGVMTLVVSVGTVDALKATQAEFYEAMAFGEIFVDLKRAPNHVAADLLEIPGIRQLETRIQAPIRISVLGFSDPIRGLMISIPDGAQPNLSQLYLREGRLPQAQQGHEIVVSDGFAIAHGLGVGDQVGAIVQGQMQQLTITGIALSPEFIYQRSPTDLFPDPLRYGVFWINRQALENLYGMQGAFNQAVMTHQSDASLHAVIDAIDQQLKPYGGRGAYGRDVHMSHRFLSEEIRQLNIMGIALPIIFLGVAAFLLNVLISRLLTQQSQDIAMLKAFGYSARAIGAHYSQLTAAIVLVGVAIGTALGTWSSGAMAQLYLDFFRFPSMEVGVGPLLVFQALVITGFAAFVGTWRVIYRVMRLAPAKAMQPPTPTAFKKGWLEALGTLKGLSQPKRIIIRNLARHRYKATLSILGIALSGALLLVGSYQFAATDQLLDVQFRLIEKADLRVVFTQPTHESALTELSHLPGALHAEGFRQVPIRLIRGHQTHRTGLLGIHNRTSLYALLDQRQRMIQLPDEGLVLSAYLAAQMSLSIGDAVWIEVMEGAQPILQTVVVDTVDDWVGVSAYMSQPALNRLLGEGPIINGAWLLVDGVERQMLFDQLWEMPGVAGVGVIHLAESQIRAFIRDSILVMMGVLLLMAGGIAFGVIYNNARLSFSERAREIATLRVLGYTRQEVAFILIGEIALLTVIAIPIGWAIGALMAQALTQTFSVEIMRIPFVITKEAYALSALGIVLASIASTALILPRLQRLNMVMALKTVE